ncbi:MAG: hypothetical protein ACKOCB_11205 [Planctomycetia bacterium]
MEATLKRLPPGEAWCYLGGQPGAKEPLDLVVRAFEGSVLVAVGENDRAPDTEPVLVPAGQGRRMCGFHFFARAAAPAAGALVSVRGL